MRFLHHKEKEVIEEEDGTILPCEKLKIYLTRLENSSEVAGKYLSKTLREWSVPARYYRLGDVQGLSIALQPDFFIEEYEYKATFVFKGKAPPLKWRIRTSCENKRCNYTSWFDNGSAENERCRTFAIRCCPSKRKCPKEIMIESNAVGDIRPGKGGSCLSSIHFSRCQMISYDHVLEWYQGGAFMRMDKFDPIHEETLRVPVLVKGIPKYADRNSEIELKYRRKGKIHQIEIPLTEAIFNQKADYSVMILFDYLCAEGLRTFWRIDPMHSCAQIDSGGVDYSSAQCAFRIIESQDVCDPPSRLIFEGMDRRFPEAAEEKPIRIERISVYRYSEEINDDDRISITVVPDTP